MRALSLVVVLSIAMAIPARAADLPATSVAFLVGEPDAAKTSPTVVAGLTAASPLTRATAARVALVRNMVELVPQLTAALEVEKESIAAREQIRALALLGPAEGIDALIQASARYPSSMDDALSDAVARRGGSEAVNLYLSKLRGPLRMISDEYFEQALWGQANLLTATASRVLGTRDERGWNQLLVLLRNANLALDGGVMRASLSSASEEIRTQSVWFLARGYAPEPDRISPLVRDALLAERVEESSDREEFGVELLRRMFERPPRTRERWLKWLATEEADALLGKSDITDAYLTDDEVKARLAHCGKATTLCPAPDRETRRRRIYAARRVTPNHFTMPAVLPEGLAAEIFRAAKCRVSYIGLAQVTTDRAGRVQAADLSRLGAPAACNLALSTILRLSLAAPAAVSSPRSSSEILLVRGGNEPPCLDEAPVQNAPTSTAAVRVTSDMKPPVRSHRVDPIYPRAVAERIERSSDSFVILESIISKSGCVRSLRIVAQSPFPELNTAALVAVSQWKFKPALQDGNPVDAIFTLTVNFRMN